MVRARVDGDHVELHTFVTHDFRRQLCYLEPYREPQSRDECGVVGRVFFTQYTAAKQSPSAKATRGSKLNARACLNIEDLNRYAMSQGWEGTGLDNLDQLLDAIIDAKLR